MLRLPLLLLKSGWPTSGAEYSDVNMKGEMAQNLARFVCGDMKLLAHGASVTKQQLTYERYLF